MKFLRYPGGKTKLLYFLAELLPKRSEIEGKYIEPFIGGGSVFLYIQPDSAIISDLNKELIDIKHPDKLAELTDDSEREVWDWLWQNTCFSLTELKEKAGIPLADWVVEKKMKPLIGNRIIYPDGTVNSFVQRYFRGEVAKLFEAKPKKAKRSNKS